MKGFINMSANRKINLSLGILQVLIGVGAIFGGFGLMMDPSGVSLGMSVELLQGTPFQNYFIPGLVLFSVNGIGTLIASYFTLKNHRYARSLAMLFGAGLTLWIVIQVALIGYQSLLQPIYFVLGIMEFSLGYTLTIQHAPDRSESLVV